MKTAILAATILLIGTAVDASAQHNWAQFCAAKFTTTTAELGAGFSTIEILIQPGNRVLREKMTRAEWTSCFCSRDDQSCDCCTYDIAKVCAEIKRREAMSNDVIKIGACEERQR